MLEIAEREPKETSVGQVVFLFCFGEAALRPTRSGRTRCGGDDPRGGRFSSGNRNVRKTAPRRVEERVRAKVLSKWFSLTRLETRTKESNMHASVRVSNPCAK